jgi:hypothetical protein
MIDILTDNQLDALAGITHAVLANLDAIGAPHPVNVD